MKKLFVWLSCLILFSGCAPTPVNVLSGGSGRLSHLSKESLSQKHIDAYWDLSMNLYEKLRKSDENTFISPTSIFLALSMTLQGASENTLIQMKQALSLEGMSDEEITEFAYRLQSYLLFAKTTRLELSNSLWIREGFSEDVQPDFIQKNKDFFGAYVASLNFSDATASKTINDWVKKNTQGLIEKIVPENIPELTVMYLINTLYFKADWAVPFKKEHNEAWDFNGRSVTMMRQESTFPYLETDDVQAIWLDYKNGEHGMVVILPKEGKTLTSSIITEVSQSIMDAPLTRVRLRLPKMDVSYEDKLNEALIELGMVDAFDGEKANFTAMSSKALDLGLHISSVVHKTVLKVDEKGTEAAAATSVEMGVTSMPIDDFVNMTVDRSFFVSLLDAQYQLPIFMGFITDPMP